LTANEVQKDPTSVISLAQNFNAMLSSVRELINLEEDPIRLQALHELTVSITHQKSLIFNRKQSKDSSTSNIEKDDQKERCVEAVRNTLYKSSVTFNDIAGLQSAIAILQEAVILPVQYPHLFTGNRKSWKRILLYGPPGTGKTRLAQAVSGEIGSAFYSVSSSDLISTWVGESEKIIRTLFNHAQNSLGPSVIFIDEVDSICRIRSSQEEDHTRRVKTELLRQMDGINDYVEQPKWFLLCSTNCPWELDAAFLRRFQKKIYIKLPCKESRLAMLHIHTQGIDVSMTDDDWSYVASLTENFTGSDIVNLTSDAVLEPIRELNLIQYSKSTNSQQVMPRSVIVSDFLKALSQTRSTVSEELLTRYEMFSLQ
jgi:vacuolar protein-sorting-associated protein 4